ncbi:MAG: TauD/TfdA family dioxygenase [Gammaproteobacteria bacterium]
MGAHFFEYVSSFFDKFNPYFEREKFIDLANIAAQYLPLHCRIKLLDLKKKGNISGYLLIKSLKTENRIPKTPFQNSSCMARGSYYSEFWLTMIASILGEPFSYESEGDGFMYHNVKPSRGNEDTLSSQSSRILLDFHTETAFHPFLPDFLLLYCLRQDRHREASTIVSSIREAVDELDPEIVNTLRQPLFKTGIDYSFGSNNGTRGNGPVLSILYGDEKDPLITFDPDLMIGLTKKAEEAQKILKSALDAKRKSILLEPGDMLIIDNRRALHGRNSFKAYYDGEDRWLQRLYVTRDLMQAEILFSKRQRIIDYNFFEEKREKIYANTA